MALDLLIAEDEPMLLEILAWEFEQAGCAVRSARNGEEAMREIDRQRPDLLLLDLLMPKANGFDVLAHVAKHHPNLPVIVLSNLSEEHDRERCLALGARDFIVKSSLNTDELATRVLGMVQRV